MWPGMAGCACLCIVWLGVLGEQSKRRSLHIFGIAWTTLGVLWGWGAGIFGNFVIPGLQIALVYAVVVPGHDRPQFGE